MSSTDQQFLDMVSLAHSYIAQGEPDVGTCTAGLCATGRSALWQPHRRLHRAALQPHRIRDSRRPRVGYLASRGAAPTAFPVHPFLQSPPTSTTIPVREDTRVGVAESNSHRCSSRIRGNDGPASTQAEKSARQKETGEEIREWRKKGACRPCLLKLSRSSDTFTGARPGKTRIYCIHYSLVNRRRFACAVRVKARHSPTMD
jgi:hypothetical protein